MRRNASLPADPVPDAAAPEILWCVTTTEHVLSGYTVGEQRALVGEATIKRSHAFRRPEDARDHIAVRILAKELLAELYADRGAGTSRQTDRSGRRGEETGGREAVSSLATDSPGSWSIRQVCTDPRCHRSEGHGKPEGILGKLRASVSWSHSAGLLACAVASGTLGLGIDAECRRHPEPPVVGKWTDWVRAEALVKTGAADLESSLRVVFPASRGRHHIAGRTLIDLDGEVPRDLLDSLQTRQPTGFTTSAWGSSAPAVALAHDGPEGTPVRRAVR